MQSKFAKCKHENKKLNTLATGETYKDLFDDLKEIIDDEDDAELRSNLLTKLANLLSKAKNDNERIEKLKKYWMKIYKKKRPN